MHRDPKFQEAVTVVVCIALAGILILIAALCPNWVGVH